MSQGVGFSGNAPARTVITKKNGEKKEFNASGGRRQAPEGELLSKPTPGPPADNGRDRGEVQSRV